MDDFLLRALAAGIGVGILTGPLGSLVVWRRMAYFGATLSHSALLGIALGLALEINLHLAMLTICVLVSLLLVAMRRQRYLATDTLLGILAHASLALGLVVLTVLEDVRLDLMVYLFGDILAVTVVDLVWIYVGGGLALLLLVRIWPDLLALTAHEELARVEGIPVDRIDLGFLLLLGVVIALAMQIVGLLLIVSLLIIPAATARRFATTPEQMALLASLAACLAVVAGLGSSLRWDTPAGPSIVVVAGLLFAAAALIPWPRVRAQSSVARSPGSR